MAKKSESADKQHNKKIEVEENLKEDQVQGASEEEETVEEAAERSWRRKLRNPPRKKNWQNCRIVTCG